MKNCYWTNKCSCESGEDRTYINLRGTRSPNLRIHNECSHELSGPDICCPMFLNAGPVLDIFIVKLRFEMLIVCGQQHSFSTQEPMLLWKCRNFKDRNCLDVRGTRTPNLRIHAEYNRCSPRLIIKLTHSPADITKYISQSRHSLCATYCTHELISCHDSYICIPILFYCW